MRRVRRSSRERHAADDHRRSWAPLVSRQMLFYLAARIVAQCVSNCSFVHLRLASQPFLHSASVGLTTRSEPGFVTDAGGWGFVDPRDGGAGAWADAREAVSAATTIIYKILLIADSRSGIGGVSA
jgi:hypothetical protein